MSVEPIALQFYSNIEDLPNSWDDLAGNRIFYTRSFLRILDEQPPSSIRQYYLTYTQQNMLIGLAIIQVKHFKLQDALRSEIEANKGIGAKLSFRIKQFLSGFVDFRIMVIGNLLLTGNYGYLFEEYITLEEQRSLLSKGISKAKAALRLENQKVHGILLKDYPETLRLRKDESHLGGYTEFQVQPGMYLPIKPEWTSMEDYYADMKSKYRLRIKNCLKNIEVVEKRIMSVDEMRSLRTQMYLYYRSISDTAGFNMFVLSPDYFERLKENLGDKVDIVGYFLEGNLIAFYSAIDNDGHLDAHFLGYDDNYNHELKLYLNMLIGLTSIAIDKQMHCVQMSRTAMEIKSSVGAIPEQYYLYLKATNPVINRMLRKPLHYFLPKEVWEQRHPFKD